MRLGGGGTHPVDELSAERGVRSAEKLNPEMIFLKPVVGYAVKILMPNGSSFFVNNGLSNVALVWPKTLRKEAVKSRNSWRESKYNARVVRVHYAHPVEIPAGEKRKSGK